MKAGLTFLLYLQSVHLPYLRMLSLRQLIRPLHFDPPLFCMGYKNNITRISDNMTFPHSIPDM